MRSQSTNSDRAEYSAAWLEVAPPPERDDFDVAKFDRSAGEKPVLLASATMPDDGALAKMGHHELLSLRKQFRDDDRVANNKLAPYEHRAYAREYVTDNPASALVMPALVGGYEASKALGLSKGRSAPSMESVKQGLIGVGEGVIEALRGRK